MYICIFDGTGQVLVHRNVPSTPAAFLKVVHPYRDGDLALAVECMFTWYWLADLCVTEGIAFVLGHALAMKATHGGKAKNDKIDSHKIAILLRGGMLPQACPSRGDAIDPRPAAPAAAPRAHTRATLSAYPEYPRPIQSPGFRKAARLSRQSSGRRGALCIMSGVPTGTRHINGTSRKSSVRRRRSRSSFRSPSAQSMNRSIDFSGSRGHKADGKRREP
jgi:hypothetical protein